MNRIIKYIWSAIALCTLASCSDDTTSATDALGPHGGKELIAFSHESLSMTRGALTRTTGFDDVTSLSIRIIANAEGETNCRYTDPKATATRNIPESASDSHNEYVGEHSDVSYVTGEERYWDDAYGIRSKLTVYAVAVPNKTKTDVTLPTWTSTAPEQAWQEASSVSSVTNTTSLWTLSTVQTETTMAKEDLVYSNNIRAGETKYNGRYHYTYNSGTSTWDISMRTGQMIWQSKSDAADETVGKFDQGHLVFKHALSWIEIRLKEGTGFNNSSAEDFKWTNGGEDADQNITLTGFSTKGTLSVDDGSWTKDTDGDVDIIQMYETTGTPAKQTTRVLNAYVVPGTTLDGVNTNVVEFEIDKNKYYVTGEQIATAIQAYSSSFTKLLGGKHYIINMSVNKTEIENITAAIVDWETVNSSDAVAENTYCTFDFEDRNEKYDSDDASKFQIYRAEKAAEDYILDGNYASHANAYAWGTTYVAATGKTWNNTKNAWEATNWYWKDNKTFYHFRAAGSTESTIPSITTAENDYYTITAGALSESDYKDYTWGAPFYDLRSADTNDWDSGHPLLTYDPETNGFDGTTPHQISKAIAATEDTIQMLMFHMTSQITVKVQTTSGADAVTLESGSNYTSVEIVNMLPMGTVLMGNGLVTANGTRADYTTMTKGTISSSIVPFTYGVVPQSLSYTEDATTKHLGLRITTPDGNQYYVRDLSTCYATVSTTNLTNPYTEEKTSGSNTWKIDRWYPGYSYTYTVTLKQKEIDRITAAVVPFETVEGNLGEINLEN